MSKKIYLKNNPHREGANKLLSKINDEFPDLKQFIEQQKSLQHARQKNWRMRHKEHIKEYNLQYAKENPELIKQQHREYLRKNYQKVLEKKRLWNRLNLDKKRASSKRYYIKYRPIILEKQKRRYRLKKHGLA
jgi:hypothetical protein